MAFGSPEPGRDLEGSLPESLQLMATELRTHQQAERQPPSPGRFRGINKQSGRHVRQLILSKDMIPFIIPHSRIRRLLSASWKKASVQRGSGSGEIIVFLAFHKPVHHETMRISRLLSHPGKRHFIPVIFLTQEHAALNQNSA